MTTKYMNKLFGAMIVACGMVATTACSDDHMNIINTDNTKTTAIDPNAQLTTCLLQTYGDFGLMDTYRSYITGFTQHFAGGWNVSNYAGSVHYNDDQARLIWDQYYSIAIKNLRDAIAHSADKPNLNAVLRIHRVYLFSVLTDTYGDVPCLSVNTNLEEGTSTPAYDKQEDIYNFFFSELKACVAQLGTGTDNITGDVTSLSGDTDKWKKYANSLRMRFAMRISDVNEAKAQEEFKAAVEDAAGYIATADDDAYIKYQNSPFTLYDGARDIDFRVNALGEILYGQDPTSPTFVCATFFNYMKDLGDPRLYSICRHYNNIKRSEIKPDKEGNVDLTDEVIAYLEKQGQEEKPCNVGAAWWNNWINGPDNLDDVPTLAKLVKLYPEVGYEKNNFPARMMRPFLSIDFCQPDRPGILFTSAEADFLMAEAITKGWSVAGTAADLFKTGIKAAIQLLNKHYLTDDAIIAQADIDTYADNILADNPLATKEGAREAINLQAWMLHMMNPAEGWANLRRADYPVLVDRTQLDKFPSDFTYDDENLSTPVRLCYPILENRYNSVNYNEAIKRMNSKNDKNEYIDDWHKRLWWDVADIHVQ
jgi:hypothetical protein